MLKIHNGANTLVQLRQVPPFMGVAADVRDFGHRIVLQAAPLHDGEDFEPWLKYFQHALLVLHVRSDGLQFRLRELLAQHGVTNYLFADSSVPAIVELLKAGERRIALRFSSREPLEQALVFAGQLEWVIVDCFDGLPLDDKVFKKLRKHFKLCVVSPELRGHRITKIKDFEKALREFQVDAILSDYPDLWPDEIDVTKIKKENKSKPKRKVKPAAKPARDLDHNALGGRRIVVSAETVKKVRQREQRRAARARAKERFAAAEAEKAAARAAKKSARAKKSVKAGPAAKVVPRRGRRRSGARQ